ncbi:3-keto-5-aminohexanoate cleavage protein [Sedimentibacter sp. MB31-C6]|uniref:3-keto-5-aminohexanoate cleavage protein n=1 Tax=Sedimentibacter sp. MB31-C6 TaxID=3109366 RepID=UPI002DDCE97F|nr:3-keto-5-aminohexanoate cleavage protein [Sedimentibacter sp. MB36-C1]WSI05327.1 3-keto-5-aminohexanoate cleavage protein [Sedimentibacter sp. MB36-C1]
MSKLIITVATTGSIYTKADTPHIPITAEEIANDVKECYNAGASVVHIHARDKDGRKTHDFMRYVEIVEKIKEVCPKIIIQLSTGGRAGLDYESRTQGLKLNPESAALTTGSVNFEEMVYQNSPKFIEKISKEMMKRNIKPEIEVYDISMIYKAIELKDKGLIRDPLYFNFILGFKNCQPATYNQLTSLLNAIPKNSIWDITGIGENQMFTVFSGISLGGHVRIGLEDNIYYKPDKLGKNVDFVERTAKLAKIYGRDIASPDEARRILKIRR